MEARSTAGAQGQDLVVNKGLGKIMKASGNAE
jgi:hypothetical protein